MNRKNFLTALLPAVCLAPAYSAKTSEQVMTTSFYTPPYLKRGDKIGITSPAGYIDQAGIQSSVERLVSWGYQVQVGKTIGKKDYTFGGTDGERAADFQEMLNDPTISAILCARGGYGAVRIIDQLDFTRFASNPKWIIGFSDVTVLHCHLSRHHQVASIHSKMSNSFPGDWFNATAAQKATIESIQQCLSGSPMSYPFSPNSNNRPGNALGELVGGNLKTIESLAGSTSDLITDDRILLVEDTGEYLYSIDRMFWNLKRTGKLARLRGLVIGGFRIKADDPGESFGKSLETIVLEKVTEYDYPVCFNFPVGHQVDNFAVKLGVQHELTVQDAHCSLNEIR